MQSQLNNPAGRNSPGKEPVRKPVLVTVLVLVLLLAAGVVLYLQKGPSTPAPAPESVEHNPQPVEEEPVLLSSGTNAVGAPNPAGDHGIAPPHPGIAAVSSKAPALPAEDKPTRAQPSAYTKRLVDILSGLDPKQVLTPEKAAEWKQAMDQLVKEGAAAIPAIQEFMDKNQDLRFNYGDGTNLLGDSNLRNSMIKALGTIGGSEALAYQAELLQTTAEPSEIALLAQQLEKQAPEQYRQLAADAARSVLDMAAGGKLADRDVGPLFALLPQNGDQNTADYLKGVMNNWRYYSAIALADLPNGAGIPALAEMVKNPENAPKGSRNVALWMLAQEADSDLARTTLLEQTQNSAVPCASWIEISSILSGNEFHIGSASAQGRVPVSGERSWSMRQGNQSFFSVPRTNPWTADQVNQRLALIDQLLAANRNCPEATGMLQKARADLQARIVGSR